MPASLWKLGDELELFLRGLDGVSGVIGDGAARLLDEVRRAPVVHKHRIECGRVHR
jgi:hypothetical protein